MTGALVSHEDAPIIFSDIVASSNTVNWNKSTYRSFPKLNQSYSSMCGAFTGRKHIGIGYAQKYGNYIDFSEEDIYQRRQNKGEPGMSFPDLISILQAGVTLKALTNVTIKIDADADNCVIDSWKRDPVGKSFSINHGIYIPCGSFETIASVIQTTGKSVMSLMFFTADEWSLQYPSIKNAGLSYNSPSALHHFVNCVDFVTFSGIQYLIVEDSAWFGGYSTRFVSKEFFQARNIPVPMANAYMMNFKFDTTDPTKTHFTGTIISLQYCLRSIGMFPVNIDPIENIGPVTKIGLSKFQATHNLPITSIFDDQTRAAITNMFP